MQYQNVQAMDPFRKLHPSYRAVAEIRRRPDHKSHRYYHTIPPELCSCPCRTAVPSIRSYVRKHAEQLNPDWRVAVRNMCPELSKRLVFYGVIGSGTFGTVLAARSRELFEGRPRHYAVKAQFYLPPPSSSTSIVPVDFGSKRCPTHQEAYYLGFVRGCEHLSQMDSAYVHGEMVFIVMDQYGIEYRPEMDELEDLNPRNRRDAPRIPGYNGEQLTAAKRPRLNEPQVCKVVSHLLGAFMALDDRSMVHGDLSHRNYLVDEWLNAQLIDLDSVDIAVEDPKNYRRNSLKHIYPLESYFNPEMCRALLYQQYTGEHSPVETQEMALDYDQRDETLWKLGVVMYNLLHGYSPWEDPDLAAPPIDFWPFEMSSPSVRRHRHARNERRDKILNDPLPIAEDLGLTQDCVDVLTALLGPKDPAERPNLHQLVQFPWFQGWFVDCGVDFTRPPRR